VTLPTSDGLTAIVAAQPACAHVTVTRVLPRRCAGHRVIAPTCAGFTVNI